MRLVKPLTYQDGTIQSTASAPAPGASELPLYYAGTTMLHNWRPADSAYNWRAANMWKIKAALKKLAAGASDVHALFIGDSTLIGYNGAAYFSDQAVPRQVGKALARLLGDVPMVDGFRFPISAASAALSDRWSAPTGWTVGDSYIFSTAAAPATWTSLDAGTSLDFIYSNAGGSFTYQIDGATAVAVTPTGTNTYAKVTVNSLTNGVHTLRINGGTTSIIFGVRVYNPGQKQLHVHNLAVGGAHANSGALGQSLSSTNVTNPVGLGAAVQGVLTAGAITPDFIVACIGNNDVGSGAGVTPAATILQGLINIHNFWPTIPIIFMHPPQVPGSDSTIFAAFTSGIYTSVADVIDCPTFDWNDWDQGVTNYVGSGMTGADGIHPNFSEEMGVARHIAGLLTSDDISPNLPIRLTETFFRDGTLTVAANTKRYYNNTGRTLTIAAVRASVGTAPTGAAVTIDILKNGVTIFTGGTGRPVIAVSTNTAVGTPGVTTWADGEYLTFSVSTIGSTVAGSDLTVQVAAA
jgi:hypothetical protein